MTPHAFAPTCSCGWLLADCDCEREQNLDGDAQGHEDRIERRCHWCDNEATRTGVERYEDGETKERRCCEECGESCDRAGKLHKRERDRDAYWAAAELTADEGRGAA